MIILMIKIMTFDENFDDEKASNVSWESQTTKAVSMDDGGFDDENEVEKETLRFSGSSARPAYPL